MEFDRSVRAFCKEHLPRELYPKEIVALDHLPSNSAGKLSRRDLQ